MGREQPQTGETGEFLASHLLQRSFLSRTKTDAGAPLDWMCSELRAAPQSPTFYRDPTLQFFFEVRTNKESQFKVTASTFRYLLARFECQPITLIFVEPQTVGRYLLWYLTLHDWMILTPSGRAALVGHSRGVTFRVDDGFAKVDAHCHDS
jgi:hypothetical protein